MPSALASQVEQRYLVEVDPVYGCLRWQGERDRDGYGFLWRGRTRALAHRVVYESVLGPIPSGMVLDHLCRRRDCVNPSHLEPVKPSENERRKKWGYRAGGDKQCRAGHRMYEHGRVTPEGGKVCLVCSPL